MSYIKLDRKLKYWEWADEPNMIAMWIRILLEANYTDGMWKGKMYEAGTFPTSLSRLAILTGMTEKQVRICLAKLQKTGEIETETTNRGMKIIVRKWSDYQLEDMKRANDEPCGRSLPRATLKEYKEDKEERKEINKEKSRPTLEQVRDYCHERNNGVDPQRWFDYYSANGWKVGKNPMKDWKACVRTWERNSNASTDTIPTYSTDSNRDMSMEDEEELLKLMGRTE